MPESEIPRSLELLREDAKQVVNELKDLPVDDWDQRNRAIMRLANVVADLINRVQQDQKNR